MMLTQHVLVMTFAVLERAMILRHAIGIQWLETFRQCLVHVTVSFLMILLVRHVLTIHVRLKEILSSQLISTPHLVLMQDIMESLANVV